MPGSERIKKKKQKTATLSTFSRAKPLNTPFHGDRITNSYIIFDINMSIFHAWRLFFQADFTHESLFR